MGKTMASLFMSISRQGILFIPSIIIASKYFGLNGLMWAQQITDIGASLIGGMLLLIVMKNIKARGLNINIKNLAPVIY